MDDHTNNRGNDIIRFRYRHHPGSMDQPGHPCRSCNVYRCQRLFSGISGTACCCSDIDTCHNNYSATGCCLCNPGAHISNPDRSGLHLYLEHQPARQRKHRFGTGYKCHQHQLADTRECHHSCNRLKQHLHLHFFFIAAGAG